MTASPLQSRLQRRSGHRTSRKAAAGAVRVLTLTRPRHRGTALAPYTASLRAPASFKIACLHSVIACRSAHGMTNGGAARTRMVLLAPVWLRALGKFSALLQVFYVTIRIYKVILSLKCILTGAYAARILLSRQLRARPFIEPF